MVEVFFYGEPQYHLWRSRFRMTRLNTILEIIKPSWCFKSTNLLKGTAMMLSAASEYDQMIENKNIFYKPNINHKFIINFIRTYLKIRSSETPANILIIQNLDLKCEVFLQILHDHNKKRQLYPKCRNRVSRASDVYWLHIWPYNLKDIGLDVLILWPFYLAVYNCKTRNWERSQMIHKK